MGFLNLKISFVSVGCIVLLVAGAGPANALQPMGVSAPGSAPSEQDPRTFVPHDLHNLGLVSDGVYDAMIAVASDPQYLNLGIHGLVVADFMAHAKRFSDDPQAMSALLENLKETRTFPLAIQFSTQHEEGIAASDFRIDGLQSTFSADSRCTSTCNLAFASCMDACFDIYELCIALTFDPIVCAALALWVALYCESQRDLCIASCASNPACTQCQDADEACGGFCLLGHAACEAILLPSEARASVVPKGQPTPLHVSLDKMFDGVPPFLDPGGVPTGIPTLPNGTNLPDSGLCRLWKNFCEVICKTTASSCEDLCEDDSARVSSLSSPPCPFEATIGDKSLREAPYPWLRAHQFEDWFTRTFPSARPLV
jgi:hypothetical protein